MRQRNKLTAIIRIVCLNVSFCGSSVYFYTDLLMYGFANCRVNKMITYDYMWFGTTRMISCPFCLPVALRHLTLWTRYTYYIAVYCSDLICSPQASLQHVYGMFTQMIRNFGHLSPGDFQSWQKGLF